MSNETALSQIIAAMEEKLERKLNEVEIKVLREALEKSQRKLDSAV